jgi:prevent-host-death family protein
LIKEVNTTKKMSATEARVHFGEVLRRVTEDQEVVIVERGGRPKAAVISIQELERLQESSSEHIRPNNRAALDWLDRWTSSPDQVGREWWEEFERGLQEHPVTFGEAQ